MVERGEEEGENSPLSTTAREGERGIASDAGAGVFSADHRGSHARAGADYSEGAPWRGAMPEQVSAEGLQPVERTHDGATERSCYRLTAMPIFLFALCCRGQGETEKLGVQSVKLSPEERGQQEGNVLL